MLCSACWARYPASGVTYGQSMLCVSLSGAALEAVGAAMKLTRPQVYNFSLSASAQAALPTLYSVAATGAYVDAPVQLLCA